MQVNIKENKPVNNRLSIETLIVILVTIGLFLTFNSAKSIVTALPAVYLLIERRLRKRTWREVGFNFKQIIADVKKTCIWVLLVAVGSPAATLILSKLFLPQYVEHVKGRVPMDINIIVPAVITITIGTFLEEIIFRGFLQERLGWIVGYIPALIISSVLFAFMHFSTGSFSIVAFDMAGIFIDSILYGIIYHKTKNIFASWVGHYLADLVSLVIVLTIF